MQGHLAPSLTSVVTGDQSLGPFGKVTLKKVICLQQGPPPEDQLHSPDLNISNNLVGILCDYTVLKEARSYVYNRPRSEAMCVPSPENSQYPGKGLTLGHQPHHMYHLIESAKAQETVTRFPSWCCLGPFPI